MFEVYGANGIHIRGLDGFAALCPESLYRGSRRAHRRSVTE